MHGEVATGQLPQMRLARGPAGPAARLVAAVSTGWRIDPAQSAAADLLQSLWESRLSGDRAHSAGIYLHGSVGSGKTALMDILLAASSDAGLQCKRMHFHELMRHAHTRMHAGADPPAIGQALGAEAPDLICLDEMQITDIADAAIVSRLLGGIFATGSALVTTSNRPPEELYAGGLNRHVYIPALCETLSGCGVVRHCLDARSDYREVRAQAASAQHAPRYYRRAAEMVEAVEARAGALGPATALKLGRTRSLPIARANGEACVLSFAELCGAPLSAADYLALSDEYACLGLHGVPPLTPAHHDAARRLITLVDVWYDRGRELHVASPAPPEELFARLGDLAVEVPELVSGGAAEAGSGKPAPAMAPATNPAMALATGPGVSMRGFGGASAGLTPTWLADGTEWSATGRLGVSESLAGLAGLNDAAFARKRAVSRLREMCCSESWPPPPPP